MRAIALILTAALAACATPQEVKQPVGGSQVAGIDPHDVVALAQCVTAIAKQGSSPEDGLLAVSLAPDDMLFSPALVAELKRNGYRVTQNQQEAVHLLEYDIGPHDKDMLVHARIDNADLIILLGHKQPGILNIIAPVTVREIEE
jgi:hypothetical protein